MTLPSIVEIVLNGIEILPIFLVQVPNEHDFNGSDNSVFEPRFQLCDVGLQESVCLLVRWQFLEGVLPLLPTLSSIQRVLGPDRRLERFSVPGITRSDNRSLSRAIRGQLILATRASVLLPLGGHVPVAVRTRLQGRDIIPDINDLSRVVDSLATIPMVAEVGSVLSSDTPFVVLISTLNGVEVTEPVGRVGGGSSDDVFEVDVCTENVDLAVETVWPELAHSLNHLFKLGTGVGMAGDVLPDTREAHEVQLSARSCPDRLALVLGLGTTDQPCTEAFLPVVVNGRLGFVGKLFGLNATELVLHIGVVINELSKFVGECPRVASVCVFERPIISELPGYGVHSRGSETSSAKHLLSGVSEIMIQHL